MSEFTAGKTTPKLTGRIADVRGRQWSTHCCPWPFSRRTTALPWNLTFDHGAKKARDGASGRSRMATINRQKIPAERPHPKAAYARCRPKPARRISPKLPDAQPRLFAFRIYEAAVRDLQLPATRSPSTAGCSRLSTDRRHFRLLQFNRGRKETHGPSLPHYQAHGVHTWRLLALNA